MANLLKQYWARLKSFSKECLRVIKITKKPGKKEFIMIVKVSGLGLVIIGTVGFILQIMYQLLFR